MHLFLEQVVLLRPWGYTKRWPLRQKVMEMLGLWSPRRRRLELEFSSQSSLMLSSSLDRAHGGEAEEASSMEKPTLSKPSYLVTQIGKLNSKCGEDA